MLANGPETLIPVSYSHARREILDADLLLCRGKGILTLGGKYVHAAMAGWWGSTLMQLELLQGWGGRAIPLSRSIELRIEGIGRDGTIDVYRPVHLDMMQRHSVLDRMIRKIGEPYSWTGLITTAAKHSILGAVLLRDEGDRDCLCDRSHPEFCSEAYSNAFRLGSGIDPVPNLPDNRTEPMHLAHSSEFRYLFTLTRDETTATKALGQECVA